MPYIKKETRKTIDDKIENLTKIINHYPEEHRDGILNYSFTKLLLNTFENESYVTYERMIGILECCKLELYRRKVSHYEEGKKVINGDVYEEE
jgi:hypothetical protein